MQEEALKNGEVFFSDLSLRLKTEGIKHLPEGGGHLPVCFGGNEICAVLLNGGLTIKKGAAENAEVGALLRRVRGIATEVLEYATLMQNAPPLIVSSLSVPYRLLAEFNCIVLGGMRTEFGTQFVTWARRGDGLLFGHYCDNNYGAAKQDFVIRAGLVEKECVFSDNHLEPSVTA